MRYLSTLLTRQNESDKLTQGGQRGGWVGRWTSKVVVATKEGKRAKAGEQMLMLFGMFNPRLTGTTLNSKYRLTED